MPEDAADSILRGGFDRAVDRLGRKLAAEKGIEVPRGSKFEFESSVDGYETSGYYSTVDFYMRAPSGHTVYLKEWGGYSLTDAIKELFDADAE